MRFTCAWVNNTKGVVVLTEDDFTRETAKHVTESYLTYSENVSLQFFKMQLCLKMLDAIVLQLTLLLHVIVSKASL